PDVGFADTSPQVGRTRPPLYERGVRSGSRYTAAPTMAAKDPDRRRRRVLLLPAPHGLAATLVLVKIVVRGLIHGLPILPRLPRRDAHAHLDMLRGTHAKACVLDSTAQSQRHVAGPV